MKKLLLILVLALFLAGCDNGISTDSKSNKDNVPGNNSDYPHITVTDIYNNTLTYEYTMIWFDGELLNIQFPECSGGCGVSIFMNQVTSFSTTQINGK